MQVSFVIVVIFSLELWSKSVICSQAASDYLKPKSINGLLKHYVYVFPIKLFSKTQICKFIEQMHVPQCLHLVLTVYRVTLEWEELATRKKKLLELYFWVIWQIRYFLFPRIHQNGRSLRACARRNQQQQLCQRRAHSWHCKTHTCPGTTIMQIFLSVNWWFFS